MLGAVYGGMTAAADMLDNYSENECTVLHNYSATVENSPVKAAKLRDILLGGLAIERNES